MIATPNLPTICLLNEVVDEIVDKVEQQIVSISLLFDGFGRKSVPLPDVVHSGFELQGNTNLQTICVC
jgi:hypothetical protein